MKREIEIDCTIALAFDNSPTINEYLAKIAWHWYFGPGSGGLIIQKKLADIMPEIPQGTITLQMENNGQDIYFLRDMVNEIIQILNKEQWLTPVLVVHPGLKYRVRNLLHKAGHKGVITPEEIEKIHYDVNAEKIWAKSPLFWWPRELLARTIYKNKGWI